jgi:hypothetical protein
VRININFDRFLIAEDSNQYLINIHKSNQKHLELEITAKSSKGKPK